MLKRTILNYNSISSAALNKRLFNLGYLARFNLKEDLKPCCFLIKNTGDGTEGRTQDKEVPFLILSLIVLDKSLVWILPFLWHLYTTCIKCENIKTMQKNSTIDCCRQWSSSKGAHHDSICWALSVCGENGV